MQAKTNADMTERRGNGNQRRDLQDSPQSAQSHHRGNPAERQHDEQVHRTDHLGALRERSNEELFQQIKDYLTRYEQTYHRKLTQKEFVIGLIEQALEEADEEFEAAEAAEAGDAAEDTEINDDVDEIEDNSLEGEVTSEDEETEDAQPDDTPEEDAETETATETCEDDSVDDGPAVDADADTAARPQWE